MIKKNLFVIVLSIIVSLNSIANENKTDGSTDTIVNSEKTVDLMEIVVESEQVILHPNSVFFKPTKREKNISFSALSLLEAMSIPMLKIDPTTESVSTASNDPVSIFIDYIEASKEDLIGLRPSDVLSVEILQSPSDPRFMGARNVVNFHMVKYLYGGYTKGNVSQFFEMNKGMYTLKSKLSFKSMTYDVSAGFDYLNSMHSGSDIESEYIYPDNVISLRDEKLISSLVKSHSSYITFRAIHNSNFKTIVNTVGYSVDCLPKEFVDKFVCFSDANIARLSDNSSSKKQYVTWNGNYSFILPNRYILNVSPSGSYSYNNQSYLFKENDFGLVNHIYEKSWLARFNATLTKQYHNFTFEAMVQGSAQGNNIRYKMDDEKFEQARQYWIGPRIHLQFNNERLFLKANFGGYFNHTSFQSYFKNEPTVNMFIIGEFKLNNKSKISLSTELSYWSISLSMRNPVLVRNSLLEGVVGNPKLKLSRYNAVTLNYNNFINNNLFFSSFAKFTRLNHPAQPSYDYYYDDGDLIFLKQMTNSGFLAQVTYGVSFNLSLFNRIFNLYGEIGGDNTVLTGSGNNKVNQLKVSLQATAYLNQFYVRIFWRNSRSFLDQFSFEKVRDLYYISAGYGVSDFNVSFKISNPFSSSWVLSKVNVNTNLVNQNKILYGYNFHRFFSIDLSYSFGYGKKINKGDEIDKISIIGSGVNYR